MSFIASLGNWLRKISTSFANASISGQNITLTRHNGDTVVLTTYAPSYSTATQSTDGLMSAQDKTVLDAIPDTYVVKVGTLAYNGLVRTSPGGHSCYAIVGGESGPNAEIADFGWDYSNRDGSGIGFRSASEEGYFLLYARDATHGSQLVGYPDGRLYWNSIKIPTLADLASSSQDGIMSASDKAKLDGLTNAVTTVSTSGTGNAVTNITANNGQLSVTKDASFFPLSGGALTGTDIFRSEPGSRLFLSGGNAWNTGSQLWLQSKEVGSGISLSAMATDGTVTTLELTPKGDLKWGGSKVLTTPTLESGTLTPTSNIGSNYSDVKKYGNVGIFILSAETPITFSGWTKYHLFTSSFKPKSYTSGWVHNQDGTQGGAFLEMETDGKIYLHTTGGTMPTNGYWHGSLVFFTD